MTARVFDFSDHAREAMEIRGASEAEVIDTIQSGQERPARHPKLGREKVFREGYEYDGRQYPHKELWVYFLEEGNVTIIATVIVGYEEWNDESII